MNKTNNILGVLLVAQLALAALTWSTCQSKQTEAGTVSVFDLKADQVTELEIIPKPNKDGKPTDTVKLVKKDKQWVVSNADDYPADNNKVKELIEKLVALRVRDPIAKNPSSHNALHVGKEEFDRKVTLKTAKVTKSIIAGSGSGQSIHVRYKGKNEVYRAKGISVWSINNSLRNYLDSKYIDVDKDKLLSVVILNKKGKLSFTKEGDGWTLDGLPEGSELDDSKVKTLITKASSVNLYEPIGKEVKEEYGLSDGTKVTLTSTEENTTMTTSYTVGAPKDEQHYYIKADNKDYVVTISKYDANQLGEKSLSDLIKKPKEE